MARATRYLAALSAAVVGIMLIQTPPSMAGQAKGEPGVLTATTDARTAEIIKLEMEAIEAAHDAFQADLTVMQLELLSAYVALSGSVILAVLPVSELLSPMQYEVLTAPSMADPLHVISFINAVLAIENAEFSP